MSVPTTRDDSFVYCWTDHRDEKLYIGFHKGSEDDGYISSSKHFLREYYKRPKDFSRQIIASGTKEDMQSFETTLLLSVRAAQSEEFYNKQNGNRNFFCDAHSEETKAKMRETWKAKGEYNCDNAKAIKAWRGQKHTDEAKRVIGEKSRRHNESRRKRMKAANPMRNPESIAKMLETRRRNKEAKHVSTHN